MNMNRYNNTKRFFSAAAVLFLLIFGACRPAAANESRSISLAALIKAAWGGNPSISAAKEDYRAAVEKYRVNTAYPDPQLMVTYFTDPIETRLGPQNWNAVFTQPIPFPGKLSKIGEISEADAEMSKLRLDAAYRDVALALAESYFELTYIRNARRIAVKNANLLKHLRKMGETAYVNDRAAFVDVMKAQSQEAQLLYDHILLAELEKTETARINGLLNRASDTPIPELERIELEPVAVSPEKIRELAESNQESIRIAGLAEKRAEIGEQLALYKTFPDFKLGLFYAGIGKSDAAMPPDNSGKDAVGVQFGMNIPLWFGKNKGRIQAARAGLRKAEALRNEKINDVRVKVQNLIFRTDNAWRLIRLYSEELIPQAQKSLVLAETWYREGEGSFSDMIESKSAFYNFQLSLERAGADYGKYLAGLERMTGADLTEAVGENQVNTEVE